MFAALVMAGCSNEDVATGGDNGAAGDTQYLTVNLVTNSSGGLRAAGDADGTDAAGDYEAGRPEENKVTKVRFYFFKANGDAAKVRYTPGGFVNYLEWENVSEEDGKMPNIEKILSATLIIQSPKGDSKPDQVVAIVNPTTPAATERSLSSLVDVAHDCKKFTGAGEFVMSNSVYAKNDVAQLAVKVGEKIHKTSGEALVDPVDIHVERAVAKVRLNSGLSSEKENENIYKTFTGQSPQKVTIGDEEKDIYVKFLGWNTTAVTDKSRLVKSINPTWKADLLGDATPWNWAEGFRSFWAINADGVDYQYGPFKEKSSESESEVQNESEDGNNSKLFPALAKTKFDGKEWVYVNENASPHDATSENNSGNEGAIPDSATKVIIAAQLVDKEGNALEMAQYGETRTTVNGLLNLYANNCGLYKKTVEGDASIYSKITPEDLQIVTATAIGKAGEDVPGRYKVYIKLTAEAEKITWYPTNSKESEALSVTEANAALLSLGAAKVWRNGYTYYFFDVKHLGGRNGIVRNHIYDAKITSLKGLGTPVYDPDEIIYPEKPVDDKDTFIAARINILSWRVVGSDVSLDW